MPSARQPGWTLAPGASLAHFGDLVIARRGDRVWAIRSRNEASDGPDADPVRPGSAFDWERLTGLGVAMPIPGRLEVLDALGVRPEPLVGDLEHLKSVRERTPGIPLLVVGDADDPAFRDAAGMLQGPCFAVWATHRSAAALRVEPGSPCVRCAIMADGELARDALAPAGPLTRRTLSSSVRALARFLAEHAVASSGSLPAGHVRTIDVVSFESRLEAVPVDPLCTCVPQDGARARTATWSDYLGRRFAPVHVQPSSGPGEPARVIFRASAAITRTDRGAFGVALGAGAEAEVTALAEGIERYCMLRPQVAVLSAPARDVEGSRWAREVIDGMLFPVAAYAQASFRFHPFDEDEPRAWSPIERLDGAVALVPTSLIGRPPGGSPRLVDATSNGYAAHPDRDRAIVHAILELVERDALLRAWLSPRPPPRVQGLKLTDSTSLQVLSGAFSLPVALAIGRRADGGVRIGSAAGASFMAAARRALAELDVAMRRDVPSLSVDLSDPGVAARPIDHVAYYDAPHRAGPVEDFRTGGGSLDIDELRARWPDEAPGNETGPLLAGLRAGAVDVWIADASRPATFGDWSVVRAISPCLLEMSWGIPYLRTASLGGRAGRPEARTEPHPFG